MKKLRKLDLDSMEREMQVLEYISMRNTVGGTVPYGTTNFNNKEELSNFLCSWASSSNGEYVEATFIFYSDGKCAVYIDQANTANLAYLTLSQDTKTGNWYFASGTNSNSVIGWGHTHQSSGSASSPDNNSTNNFSGTDRYVYYDCSFNKY
jgi:hypothetical protein